MKDKASGIGCLVWFIIIVVCVLFGTLGGEKEEDKTVEKEGDKIPIERPVNTSMDFDFDSIGSVSMPDVSYPRNSYKISYTATLVSNAHVGSSWSKGVQYDGEYIENDAVIQMSERSLKCVAIEQDSYDDVGTCLIDFEPLSVGEWVTYTAEVVVRENRGRYSGNVARWEFEVTIECVG